MPQEPQATEITLRINPWLYGHLIRQARSQGTSVPGYILALLRQDHAERMREAAPAARETCPAN